MSRRKTERLLNLVVCLLATGHYLTAEQIRHAVPGYPPGDEAFKRMFERDKEELRELGIPLETGLSAGDEAGYRIPRQAYELPELHLTPDEAAVLGLAARVWQRASLAEAASGALLKLRAAGIDTDAMAGLPGIMGIEPRVDTDEQAFPVLWQAVRDRRPVAFDYQGVGRSAPQRRHLEPWGVVSRRGRWYVVGHDTDRDGVRVFRLSRMIGDVVVDGAPGTVVVPEGVDVRALAFDRDEPPAEPRVAAVRLRAGRAHGVRRWARGVTRHDDDWDSAELTFTEVDWFAPYLARFADDVMVIDPPDLREAVIHQLKAVLT
ncbi:MAG TPA: YafY family protein [Streptosporangiaceae bacterium]|nr:YafY family protein [Streptosporangiaceae bacterium]